MPRQTKVQKEASRLLGLLDQPSAKGAKGKVIAGLLSIIATPQVPVSIGLQEGASVAIRSRYRKQLQEVIDGKRKTIPTEIKDFCQ